MIQLNSLSPARWLLATLVTLTPFATAQTWTQQAPEPTALELWGVCTVSAQEAWAVGETGVLAHTTDAGRNWTRSNFRDDAWKVTFVDPLYGWAVGNDIYRTTDGGANWTLVTGLANSTFDAVYFLDRQNGWASEYLGLWRTTDGGISWTFHPHSWLSGAGAGLFFHDALNGWAVAVGGRIEKTIDGGQTWTVMHTEPAILYRIWFVDQLEGWVIAHDRILYTADGGATWSTRAFPPGERASSASFVPPTVPGQPPVCYTAGLGGSVVKSTDGWLSYTVLRPLGNEPALNDISFSDANNGFAVGEWGRILFTWDGGRTWISRQGGGQGELYKMDANDVAHAWTAAELGQVIFTSDAGNHWEQVLVDGFSKFGSVMDVDFLDDNVTGWAGGIERGFYADSGIISKSLDGGRTWQQQYVSPSDFRVLTVGAFDNQTAVGAAFRPGPFAADLLVRTADGGSTWQDVTPAGPVGIILCSDFVDSTVGYLACGRVWKTVDAGLTWTEMANPTDVIEGISFVDADHGWGVGAFGYIWHTTDGAQTWTRQAAGQFPNHRMFDVSAVSTQDAWLVAQQIGYPYRKDVMRTTNGGATWTPENVPGLTNRNNAGIRTVAFVDADYGWVGAFLTTGGIGAEGGIWRRTNGPPAGLMLAHDRLLLGSPAQFRITGATPGDLSGLVLSTTGIAGTAALNLLPPLYLMGLSLVDGSGNASFGLGMPSGLPSIEVHFQALVVGSSGVIVGTNTTTAWIEH